MNEAQRFLRYVTPGLVFLVETLVLLLVLVPTWTVDHIKIVEKDKGLGFAFAALLMSGGIGFVFSVIHHVIHWTCVDARMLDHSRLIARLCEHRVIHLADAKTDTLISDYSNVTRVEAWLIATSLWNERLKTSEVIKGADPQVQRLANMMHATGTARVATLVACFAVLVIAAHVSECASVPHIASAAAVAAVLLLAHHLNYCRVSRLVQGLVEEVLHDALLCEAESKSIRTNVILTSKKDALSQRCAASATRFRLALSRMIRRTSK